MSAEINYGILILLVVYAGLLAHSWWHISKLKKQVKKLKKKLKPRTMFEPLSAMPYRETHDS